MVKDKCDRHIRKGKGGDRGMKALDKHNVKYHTKGKISKEKFDTK